MTGLGVPWLTTVVLGLFPHALAAPETGSAVTGRDDAVIGAVLDDLLTYGGDDSPVDGGLGPSKPLRLAEAPLQYAVSAEQALFRLAEEPWGTLTPDQERGSREAARDLADRAVSPIGRFAVLGPEVEVVAENEGATAVLFDGPIKTYLPGYSSDGAVALVVMYIPWSIHSVGATYVLQLSGGVWHVVLRQFAYYLSESGAAGQRGAAADKAGPCLEWGRLCS